MLYVTTRNNCDTNTAQKALRENRAGDGGMYVPFQKPELPKNEKSINSAVAQVLNTLFQTRLTAWDVDFSVGRHPVRLTSLRQRTVMTESWHNPDWTFERMVNNLTSLLAGDPMPPGDWVRIAVRIAVLWGVFGELKKCCPEGPVDIAVVSGDFIQPISAWYAKQWGLPIGNIICCCNENNSVWNLLTYGQLRTDEVAVSTCIPQADVVVPSSLERLIFACGGAEEVDCYLECCRRGRMYCPGETVLERMRSGMCASVVSSQRIERTIRGAYATHGYLLSPASALAYAGLLDYRAKTGKTRLALVLTEESPILYASMVSKAIGVPEGELKHLI